MTTTGQRPPATTLSKWALGISLVGAVAALAGSIGAGIAFSIDPEYESPGDSAVPTAEGLVGVLLVVSLVIWWGLCLTGALMALADLLGEHRGGPLSIAALIIAVLGIFASCLFCVGYTAAQGETSGSPAPALQSADWAASDARASHAGLFPDLA